MNSLSKLYKRVTTDRAFRRGVLMVVVFGVLLAAEVLVLSLDIPGHLPLVQHIAAWVAVVLFPLTMLAIVARSPIGKRYTRQRFVIRPLVSLKSPSTYDGGAMASLLYYSIVNRRSKSTAGRMEGRTSSYAMPNTSVSLAGASISLDWLWSLLRYAITGKKDVIIEGLIQDTDTPIRLNVWPSSSEYTWIATLRPGPFVASLDVAITELTDAILTSLDPVALASYFSDQWRYDEAIRLIAAEESTVAQQVQMISMNLEGGHLREALRLTQKVKLRKPRKDLFFEVQRLEAEILIRQGKFEEARDILDAACRNPQCKPEKKYAFLSLYGDSNTYERKYEEAIKFYDEALDEALKYASSLAGEPLVRLVQIADRSLSGDIRTKAFEILYSAELAVLNRARCRTLIAQRESQPPSAEVKADLLFARELLDKVRLLGIFPDGWLDVDVSVVASATALYYLRIQALEPFQRSANEAVRFCTSAIQFFEYALEQDRNSPILSNLGWCYFGKAFCLRLLQQSRTAQNPDNPIKAEVEQLCQLFSEVPFEEAQSAWRQFQRASDRAAQSNDAARMEHLRRAAQSFSESLLKKFGPDMPFRLPWILSLGGSSDGTAEIEGEPPVPGPKDIPSINAGESGLDPDEVYAMYRAFYRLFERIGDYGDKEEMNGWIEAGTQLAEANRCVQQSRNFFGELNVVNKAPGAESAYGLAGVAALDGDAVAAVSYLRQAGDEVGESTFFYRNRAMLSEAFDNILESPEFQRYLSGVSSRTDPQPEILAIPRA